MPVTRNIVRLSFIPIMPCMASLGWAAGAATEDARLVPVPGSPAVLKLWEATDATGACTPHYAISIDGRDFSEPQATSYEVRLHHGSFDPLVQAAAVEPGFEAGADTNLFIVQYLTQPLPAFKGAVEAAGGQVLSYLPQHSHLVRMTARDAGDVAALPFVRWVGAFHPAFRLERAVLDAIVNGELGDERMPYYIHAATRGMADKQVVSDRITALGGTVDMVSPETHLMSATLSVDELMDIVRMDEVLFIDRRFPPQTYLNNVRVDGGANEVESLGGYTGAGVRAEVIDSGLFMFHQAWGLTPLIHAPNSSNTSHGTQVYGCVFSDGTGNSAGRGMIPAAQGIFSSYSNLGNRYVHTLELVAPPWNAVFQTNSWGSCCSTQYGTQGAYMDSIAFDSDLVILQAQANTGTQASDVSAWAKNIVSVGGIRHQNTLSRSDDNWFGAGSIGPAADGRVKPDLSYWYDSILTTSNSGGYTGSFGGTSAATPKTAGHFGLMFEMWADGIFGNEVDPSGTVFENRPHLATAKALMVNTAEPYNFVGENADLTRTHQGWGLANVGNLYELRDRMLVVDEEIVLTLLETAEWQINVEAGEPRFRATLVYTDPPGNPAADYARINDMNLKVTSPSGTFYWGNNGLLQDNTSTSAGNPNIVDTVENVWIENPEAGTWTVQVIAREVNEDGHPETPELDVDFALVVTGGTTVKTPQCPEDVNSDGVVDTVDFLEVLAEWGNLGGPADVNSDGVVDTLDFLEVLAAWGPCPE